MATKAQAVAELKRLGFELDESVTSFDRCNGFAATFDPIGRVSIGGDCRGCFEFNYTASASEFWQQVIDRAREEAPFLAACPMLPGECDFHDAEEETWPLPTTRSSQC
jgi:hypothetical protein